jgi:DNA-binding transcriptional ArsR family regulator
MNPSIFEFQASFCKAMGNPIRLQVIHALRDQPKTVTEIMQDTGSSQSNISRHLSVLRGIGVVKSERHGTEIFYCLADPKAGEVCDLVRKMLSEQMHKRLKIIQG